MDEKGDSKLANKRKLPNGTLIGLGPDKTGGGAINIADGKVIVDEKESKTSSNIAVTEAKPTANT